MDGEPSTSNLGSEAGKEHLAVRPRKPARRARAAKRVTQPMDKQDPLRKDLKRTVRGIEARLEALAKVFRVSPTNLAAIKKKVGKAGLAPDDPLVKEVASIEEMLLLMARIFGKTLDPRAVNKFIAAMHRDVLSPTRQARITEYFHIAGQPPRPPDGPAGRDTG